MEVVGEPAAVEAAPVNARRPSHRVQDGRRELGEGECGIEPKPIPEADPLSQGANSGATRRLPEDQMS